MIIKMLVVCAYKLVCYLYLYNQCVLTYNNHVTSACA